MWPWHVSCSPSPPTWRLWLRHIGKGIGAGVSAGTSARGVHRCEHQWGHRRERCIASHHTTSHHITPHRIASHHIASHHTVLHHIASHRIASHHTTSHRIASHHLAGSPLLGRNDPIAIIIILGHRTRCGSFLGDAAAGPGMGMGCRDAGMQQQGQAWGPPGGHRGIMGKAWGSMRVV